jgi:hypothetical protein
LGKDNDMSKVISTALFLKFGGLGVHKDEKKQLLQRVISCDSRVTYSALVEML